MHSEAFWLLLLRGILAEGEPNSTLRNETRFKQEVEGNEEKTAAESADWEKGMMIGGAALLAVALLLFGSLLLTRSRQKKDNHYKVSPPKGIKSSASTTSVKKDGLQGSPSSTRKDPIPELNNEKVVWDWRGPPSFLEEVTIPSSSGSTWSSRDEDSFENPPSQSLHEDDGEESTVEPDEEDPKGEDKVTYRDEQDKENHTYHPFQFPITLQ